MNADDLKMLGEAAGDVLAEELRRRDGLLKAEIAQLQGALASTDALLADQDARLAKLEGRHAGR
jgi:hypothetical protein